MYLFDTNIFLEILLGQKRAQDCESCLTSLHKSQLGYISSFSLHSVEVLLARKKKYVVLRKFLSFIQEHPFLYTYATSLNEELELSRLLSKLTLDFDDALQYFVAKKNKLTLVTLDKDFQVIHDIPIRTPLELLT